MTIIYIFLIDIIFSPIRKNDLKWANENITFIQRSIKFYFVQSLQIFFFFIFILILIKVEVTFTIHFSLMLKKKHEHEFLQKKKKIVLLPAKHKDSNNFNLINSHKSHHMTESKITYFMNSTFSCDFCYCHPYFTYTCIYNITFSPCLYVY